MIASLQTRLLLAVSLLALAAVVAVALSARQWTRIEFKKFRDLEQRVTLARTTSPSAIAGILDRQCCAAAVMQRAAASLRADEIVLVVADDGELIAAAGPATDQFTRLSTRVAGDVLTLEAVRDRGGAAETLALQFRGHPPVRVIRADGTPALAHVMPMPRADDPLPPDVRFLGSVDRRLLFATIVISVLAVAATWIMARRIVRPIGELGRAAGDLARGQLSRRVVVNGSGEIAELARSFNAMAAELERQQTLRRDLVHDVAHELRTPLTALRCRLETIIDGLASDPRDAIDGANEEVRHLSRLVDDLQELALAEARELRLSVSRVPLADVAVSAARAAGLDHDPRLVIDIEASVAARADVVRVRQVVLNLLTNADRYTPASGRILVSGSRQGSEVRLDVENSGSRLGPDQLARIFDRFYRSDPARHRATGGTGLGLAVVKHLIEAQGGRVQATSSESGLIVGFTLPAA